MLPLAVNETAVLETAHLMASLGLKDAGYEYLVVDGAWNGGCVVQGVLGWLTG